MCRAHMVDVRDDYERFREAGGDVVVVTMGTTTQVQAFRERNRLPFSCFADPDQIAYRAYGLRRGSGWQVAGPATWGGGLKAIWRVGIGRPTGDIFQLQGSFVVDVGGAIRYAHLAKHSADQATNDELIVQLQGL